MSEEGHKFTSDSDKAEDGDDLIDAFIEAAGRDSNPLTEENWEQEIEQVPLFMTKPIDPSKELSPGLAAIQSLIYNNEDPNESARAYKEEGTELFKKTQYKRAIDSYSEGLKLPITDEELRAQLLNNRAAAQSYLGNHGKALEDAITATILSPEYGKALIRCATSCYELKRWSEAIQWSERALKLQTKHKRMEELRKSCQEKLSREAISDKRRNIERENKQREDIRIIQAILSRGIRTGGSIASLCVEDLEKQGQYRLTLDESSGTLSWPVMLLYPETQQSDLIAGFNENSTLGDQLEVVLSEPPAWDTEAKYKMGRVRVAVFMEGEKKYYNARLDQTLLSILKHPSYILTSLVPTLYLHCKE